MRLSWDKDGCYSYGHKTTKLLQMIREVESPSSETLNERLVQNQCTAMFFQTSLNLFKMLTINVFFSF